MYTVCGYHRFRLAGILALALVVALLAACDSQAHTATTPTATSTTSDIGFAATATPASTYSTPGASPTVASSGGPNSPVTPPAYPLAVCTSNGGATLAVSQASLSPLDPTGLRLADNLPLKPMVYLASSTQQIVSLTAHEQVSYTFNAPPANQVGYVCGVTMRITAFQPLSAPMSNVTLPCVDQSYLDPGGWLPSSACPGSAGPAGEASVTFSSSSVGTTATSAMINPYATTASPGQTPPSAGSNYPQYMLVSVHVPAAGTYAFSVRFWQTRSGPTVAAPDVTATFAFGQYLHEWGGQQCTASGMQSQLPPPSNPPSHVICPGPPQQH